MTVKHEDGNLVITIALQPAKDSSSGKTKVVASETAKTEIEVDGKLLTVGVNAYYKK